MVFSERSKLILMAVLAVAATVLLVAHQRLDDTWGRSDTDTPASPLIGGINTVVDSLFSRYRIERRWVRTRHVQSPDKKFFRTEQRVFVNPDFVSVQFVHELNLLLRPLGATAIATERSREQVVTVHIKRDAKVVQSIAFVTKQDLGANEKSAYRD